MMLCVLLAAVIQYKSEDKLFHYPERINAINAVIVEAGVKELNH